MSLYQSWNKLLLEQFFYNSSGGNTIRLDVSPGWFDGLSKKNLASGYPEIDFQNARSNLIHAVCGELVGYTWDKPGDFSTMFENALNERTSPPTYLPLLAFFCIAYGEIDSDDSGAYYEYIRTQYITDEFPYKEFQEKYKERIENFCKPYKRFSEFIPKLFYKLKNWADTSPQVNGIFCFARLHGNPRNKTSYFMSQILLRPKDEEDLMRSFGKLPPRVSLYGKEKLMNELKKLKAPYLLPTAILNLYTENTSVPEDEKDMRQLLWEEAKKAVYSIYGDWLEEGRPDYNSKSNSGNSSSRRSSMRLFLALSMRKGKMQKHLFVPTFDLEKKQSESFKINGAVFSLKSGPSFAELINSQETERVWDEIANGKNTSEFVFQKSDFYVMTYRHPYLIQDEFNCTPPRGDYYLLYRNDARETAEKIKKNGGKSQPFGDKFQLAYCPEGTTVGESKKDDFQGRQVKLVGGIRTKYRMGFKEYLMDFLPTIEAYLPDNDFDLDIISGKDDIKIVEDVTLKEDDGAYEHCDSKYSWRSFKIICQNNNVSYCKILFVIDNKNGKLDSHELDFYIINDELAVDSSRKMDRFGELVELEEGESYWPLVEEDWQVLNSGEEKWDEYDVDFEKFPWEFFKDLKNAAGKKGMPYRTFDEICRKRLNQPAWRYKSDILLLSYLSVLDIFTDSHGLWSKFFPLPAVIYALPDRKNFILTGCYSKETLIALRDEVRKTDSCKIMIKAQNPGKKRGIKLLPPWVKLTGECEKLQKLAHKFGIEWQAAPPAVGYINLAASVKEWFDEIWEKYLRPTKGEENFNLWYSPLRYKIEEQYSPLRDGDVRQSFGFYEKNHPFIKNVKCFQMTRSGSENYFVYVYDRSWARWMCHSNIRKKDEASPRVFKIPYDRETGTLWLPVALKLPKVIARAAVAFTGKIPEVVENFELYKKDAFAHGLESYNGLCACFRGIPEDIAGKIAEKIHAECEDIHAEVRSEDIYVCTNTVSSIVELLRLHRDERELFRGINEIAPVSKLRKTQIFYAAEEDDRPPEECGEILAKSIMKYVLDSWAEFYRDTESPSDEERKKKSGELQKQTAYFLLSNRDVFFGRGRVLEMFKQSPSWEERIGILCRGIGQISANFTLPTVKHDFTELKTEQQREPYQAFYRWIKNVMGAWDEYYCSNSDESDSDANADFDSLAEKILKDCKTEETLTSDLLSGLDCKKCCSRLFENLLDDSRDISKQRNLIIKETENVLEEYVEKLKGEAEK